MFSEMLAALTGASVNSGKMKSMLRDVIELMEKEIDIRYEGDISFNLETVLEFISQEVCNIVVEKYTTNFRDVPDEYITQQMCVKVLKSEVNEFEYVPERFFDDPEIVEVIRCKGGNGECKVLWCDGKQKGMTDHCCQCRKVICNAHRVDRQHKGWEGWIFIYCQHCALNDVSH